MPEQYVLTVVSTERISDDDAKSLMPSGEIKRLSANAFDIFLNASDKENAKAAAERLGKIDYCLQPVISRQKKLLITDMDSTIITCECIDEIADFAGVKEKVAGITERAMRGELDFKAALRERVALLEGLDESVLQQVYNERVKFMGGAKELISAFRKSGGHTVLVSGGFSYFTARVRSDLGFDEDSSNFLEIKNCKLTGKVIEPILDKEAKLKTLQDTCARLGISTQQSLAIGDGANDIPMIKASGLGIAYHGKPIVREAASASVNYCNHQAVLYFLGLGATE